MQGTTNPNLNNQTQQESHEEGVRVLLLLVGVGGDQTRADRMAIKYVHCLCCIRLLVTVLIDLSCSAKTTTALSRALTSTKAQHYPE